MIKGYLIRLNPDTLHRDSDIYQGPRVGIIYKTKNKPKAWLRKWGEQHGEVVPVTIIEHDEDHAPIP
jgi:hypothetical protein